MNIVLPPEIEQAVAEHARKQGTTLELLVLESLRDRFVPSEASDSPGENEGSLADFLSEHIGVLHSSEHIQGGARMSEDSGKKFAVGMVKKRQQGRL